MRKKIMTQRDPRAMRNVVGLENIFILKIKTKRKKKGRKKERKSKKKNNDRKYL